MLLRRLSLGFQDLTCVQNLYVESIGMYKDMLERDAFIIHRDLHLLKIKNSRISYLILIPSNTAVVSTILSNYLPSFQRQDILMRIIK